MQTWTRRIGAALLALCLTVLLAPVPGVRADDARVALSFASDGWDGDSYTVRVLASVDGDSFEMYSGQISLLFDPAVLTLTSASPAEIDGLSGTASTFDAADGSISFDYLPADLASLDNASVPDGQVLGTAVFAPADDAARSASASLSFSDTDARPTEIGHTDASGYQAHTLDASASHTVPAQTPPAPDAATYAVEVSGGTGSGTYAPGESVTIEAPVMDGDGRAFWEWTWTGPSGFAPDGGSSKTTFIMPAGDVTASPKYRTPGGCYVATSVYGSYDCPEVWTLRRFRDEVLAESWYGRLFVRAYYAVSPAMVELFGGTDWFRDLFRGQLDGMVSALQEDGFASTPYEDLAW